MFCSNCKKQIADHINFCPYCGKPVKTQPTENQPVENQPVNQPAGNQPMVNQTMGNQTMGNQSMEQPENNKNKNIIVILSIAAVITIMIFIGLIILLVLLLGEGNRHKDNDYPISTTEATTIEDTTEKKQKKTTTEATTEATTEDVTISNDQMINSVIVAIESYPDYRGETEGQAIVEDVDGDGCTEVIAVYECTDYTVRYDVWHITETGADKIWSSDLYQEVGGNSGSVGYARYNGKVYLKQYVSTPSGDSFSDCICFYPFSPSGGAISFDDSYYFSADGVYGDEENGVYIFGIERMSKSKYDSKLAEFEQHYDADIYGDSGNGGVMPFSVVKQYYK